MNIEDLDVRIKGEIPLEIARNIYLRYYKYINKKYKSKIDYLGTITYNEGKITSDIKTHSSDKPIYIVSVVTHSGRHSNLLIINNINKKIYYIEPQSASRGLDEEHEKMIEYLSRALPDYIDILITGDEIPIQTHLDLNCGKPGHCLVSNILILELYLAFYEEAGLIDDKQFFRLLFDYLMRTKAKETLFSFEGEKDYLLNTLCDYLNEYSSHLMDAIMIDALKEGTDEELFEDLKWWYEYLEKDNKYLDPGWTFPLKKGGWEEYKNPYINITPKLFYPHLEIDTFKKTIDVDFKKILEKRRKERENKNF